MISSPEAMRDATERFGKLALKIVQVASESMANPKLYESGRLTAHEDLDAILDILTNDLRRSDRIMRGR